MIDNYGRNIEYMRISITDRCNLRCKYCMPEDIETTSMDQLLTYEEICAVVESAVKLGIVHFRITGGEPLVRKDCALLVKMIAGIQGVQSVTMTSNGIQLTECARQLKENGLKSVNVSLDTMDQEQFVRITGKDMLAQVLQGIQAAKQAGLPVKINTVNQRGLDWRPLLDYAQKQQIPIRFIEMMPIGYGKKYVERSNEILIREMEQAYGSATPVSESYGSGPAVYYRFGSRTEPVGFISAMHGKFCDQCNRIRLTSMGWLKLCLCYDTGLDLREILRDSRETEKSGRLLQSMREAIAQKPKEHCFEDVTEITEEKAMVRIGG